MSNLNTTVPAVRLTVESVEGNIGGYLSLEFLRTVNVVFDEMLSRLYHGAKKRKDWATAEPWKELTEHECRTCIRDSLAKGKLIDAMNYLMFAHLNGHKLLSLRNPSIDEPVSIDSQMRDQLANALGVTGRSWDEMLDTASKWAKIAAKAESISETLKTAYEKEKLVEKIAQELKLDPEASEERILSTIHMLVTTRQAELKSADFGFMRPDGQMIYGIQGDTLVINGAAVKNLAPGQTITPAPININITGCADPDTLENIAKMIKANRQNAGVDGAGHTKNTVTIKNEAAPDLFPEQRIKIKAGAKWPHMTPPAGAVEELKWPRTTPPEGGDKTRKTALPNAMAAPYGVTTAYDKAAEDCQGVVYEKYAPELRPSTTDTNDDLDLTMVADDSGIRSTLFRFKNEKDRDDYLPLLRTFLGALEQAAYGKGRERHANDLPFIEQPILTMAHMLDSDAGLAQQVIKKTVEARSLPTKQARINELRGTLVYAAAMILFEEMYGTPDAKPSSTSRSVVPVKISDLQAGMVIRFDRDYIAVVEGLIGTQIGDDGKINFWWSVRRERGGVQSKGVVFGPDGTTFNVDNDPDNLDGAL